MKKEVEFKSDGLTLKGTLYLPEGKKDFGGALLLHGSGSRRKNYLPVAEALSKKGIAALAFDFRGCGESEGDFEKSTVNDNVTDAQAALDFLLKQPGIKQTNVGVVGASRGGHVAAVLAAKNPDHIVSLILRAPVAYPKSLVDSDQEERKNTDWIKEKTSWSDSPALEAIEKFENFLLLVASEKDEIIPSVMIKEYEERSNAKFVEVQTILGATHNLGKPDSPERKEFIDIVTTWFTREG
jgi:dienelactone hydrolase